MQLYSAYEIECGMGDPKDFWSLCMNLDVFKSINGCLLIAKDIASTHESGGEILTASV